jgi:hypothetical protein
MKKFLVSSSMRVGSTVIGKICCTLLNKPDHRLFIDDHCLKDGHLNLDYIREIISDKDTPIFLKSHIITPPKILEIFNSQIDLPIINVRRNLKDSWISRFFYNRYHRTLNDSDSYNDLLDTIPDMNHLSDSDFMKLLCRHPLGKHWAKEHLEFENDNSLKNYSNYIYVNYEDLLNDPHSLCLNLAEFLGSDNSSSHIDFVINENSFSKLSKLEETHTGRKGSYKFFRNGKSNIWNEYLNEDDYQELIKFD